MKFKEYLQESFDSNPVPWRMKFIDENKDKTFPYEDEASFQLDGNTYSIDLAGWIDEGAYAVEFAFSLINPTRGHLYGLTNTGNQFKVLATVMSFIETIIKKYPIISMIQFSAENKSEVFDDGVSSNARARVYKRLIERYTKRLPGNWKLESRTIHYVEHFYLKKTG